MFVGPTVWSPYVQPKVPSEGKVPGEGYTGTSRQYDYWIQDGHEFVMFLHSINSPSVQSSGCLVNRITDDVIPALQWCSLYTQTRY